MDVYKYVNKTNAVLTIGSYTFTPSGFLQFSSTQADLDALEGISVDKYINGVPYSVEYTPNRANFTASTTTRASLNIPVGVAPTTPIDGDIWNTTAGLILRKAGVSEPIGGAATSTWKVKTVADTGYTAVSGDMLLVDTSGGAVTINLPANPAAGDWVKFKDGAASWQTNNLTVGRNGSTIETLAENYICQTNRDEFTAVFNTTWRP